MEQVYCERFLKYREQIHLTQEELAERIGVSRQTVSKWERGEASPDTENLLKLSELYGVSIDVLLHRDPSTAEKAANGAAGETARDVSEAENATDGAVSGAGDKANETNEAANEKKHDGFSAESLTGAVALAAVIVYLLLGFCFGLWHPGWVVFFQIPIFATFAEAMDSRQNGRIQWSVLTGTVAIAATGIYLLLGFWRGLWHPGWLVFLMIPIWAIIAEALDRMD